MCLNEKINDISNFDHAETFKKARSPNCILNLSDYKITIGDKNLRLNQGCVLTGFLFPVHPLKKTGINLIKKQLILDFF